MIRDLLRPFSYLTIKHDKKWRVDWLLPISLALVTVIPIFILKLYGTIPLYSSDGLIQKILNFIQILPGFYIAALAAIATFNKSNIDEIMPAPAPKTNIILEGKKTSIDLTRRRFLCLMFAFLTAECLILIIVGIIAQSFYIPLRLIVPDIYHPYLSIVFLSIFTLLFWQMIITSFWGLFYLGDRLHQPDRT